MADILASPLAFELCEGGTCGEPKPDAREKNVSCTPNDKCAKAGCYCQLFKRKKGSADTIPWEVPRANHDKEVKYEKDEFDYKCLCVKPILEHDETIEGEKYAMRFIPCGLGTCGLDPVVVPYKDNPLDPDSPIKTRKEFKCSGACEGDCKCTLFRLQIRGRGFDPKAAKWEYMAKANKQIPFDDKYIYRCFCLK